MSLFNEIESCIAPDVHEPNLIEIEKHPRKKKYAGQRDQLVNGIPHCKVPHTIDENEQICERCENSMVRVCPYRGTIHPCQPQNDRPLLGNS